MKPLIMKPLFLKPLFLLLMAALSVGLSASLSARASDVNTFSIVAHDPVNGDWGVAVASRYFAVGSVVPWAEADAGAIATQANVNVGYGPRGLELLRTGMAAKDVVAKLLAEDKFPPTDGRQVAIVDRKGNIAAYTGPTASKWAGDRQGRNWTVLGNSLPGPQVLEAMGNAFEAEKGELAEKLFVALKAGNEAGGDQRGKQSASLLVVRKQGGRNLNNDRYVYVNVDDNPEPIKELRRLLDLNLGLLYTQKVGPLTLAHKNREARDAAALGAHYIPTADAYFALGVMDYRLGDKAAALAEIRTAIRLDPVAVRQRLESTPDSVPPGTVFAGLAIHQDKEFLKQALAK
jgi:uncharacterized Ntn-hydrolase superfamily protein